MGFSKSKNLSSTSQCETSPADAESGGELPNDRPDNCLTAVPDERAERNSDALVAERNTSQSTEVSPSDRDITQRTDLPIALSDSSDPAVPKTSAESTNDSAVSKGRGKRRRDSEQEPEQLANPEEVSSRRPASQPKSKPRRDYSWTAVTKSTAESSKKDEPGSHSVADRSKPSRISHRLTIPEDAAVRDPECPPAPRPCRIPKTFRSTVESLKKDTRGTHSVTANGNPAGEPDPSVTVQSSKPRITRELTQLAIPEDVSFGHETRNLDAPRSAKRLRRGGDIMEDKEHAGPSDAEVLLPFPINTAEESAHNTKVPESGPHTQVPASSHLHVPPNTPVLAASVTYVPPKPAPGQRNTPVPMSGPPPVPHNSPVQYPRLPTYFEPKSTPADEGVNDNYLFGLPSPTGRLQTRKLESSEEELDELLELPKPLME